MAAVTQEIRIEVPPERLFDVIVDYARYPEFVPGVRSCRPRQDGGARLVDYEVDLGVRRVRYSLRHVEERPHRVTWSLASGDAMRISNGSWELAADGTGTRARYTVEVQIAKPPLVPRAVIDALTEELTRVQLPRTLAAFKERAEATRGG